MLDVGKAEPGQQHGSGRLGRRCYGGEAYDDTAAATVGEKTPAMTSEMGSVRDGVPDPKRTTGRRWHE